MEQVLPVSCWQCLKEFHVIIKESDYRREAERIQKKFSCPHCNSVCTLTLRESDIFDFAVSRSEDDVYLTDAEDDDRTLPNKDTILITGPLFPTYKVDPVSR